jgi:AhpD family alkylhydroperoxidase
MRRTYTLRSWTVDAIKLMLASPRLCAIYGRGRLTAGLRERVMVAVGRANACGACTRVHEAWALRAGVSAEDLEQISAGGLPLIIPEEGLAVVYATALAEARCGRVHPDAQPVADAYLGVERQRDIEAIAQLMTFANLSVNTAHVLHRGLRRNRERIGDARL